MQPLLEMLIGILESPLLAAVQTPNLATTTTPKIQMSKYALLMTVLENVEAVP